MVTLPSAVNWESGNGNRGGRSRRNTTAILRDQRHGLNVILYIHRHRHSGNSATGDDYTGGGRTTVPGIVYLDSVLFSDGHQCRDLIWH